MDERTLSMNRLAAGIVMTCKGMPFFQAGEEFARTKHGEGNSFKSSWQLQTKFDWTRALRAGRAGGLLPWSSRSAPKISGIRNVRAGLIKDIFRETRSQVTNWNTRMAAQSASSTIHGKKKLCRNSRKETGNCSAMENAVQRMEQR